MYNLRTIKQLQIDYPYVDWLSYINGVMPPNVQVTEDEVINLSVPSFYDELGKVLASTDNRIICNYLMWRIHAFSVGFLSEEFRKRQLVYGTILSGKQEQEPRWKECIDVTAGR